MKTMKRLFMACMALITMVGMYAQEVKDDSKYLAGAVPEVDGKVLFAKDFSIPGMDQNEIFERMQQWMDARLKKNDNTSRILLTEPENGLLVGMGDEWIVFSSTALSLDRTRILYQLTVNCAAEKCRLEVSKIRYVYREGKEKYTAEEWIVDKYALNKTQTKLVWGLAKWRRKTVDFVDALCLEVADALSAVKSAPAQTAEVSAPDAVKEPEKTIVNSGTMVIVPKNAVTVETQQAQTLQPTAPVQAPQVSPAQPVAAQSAGYHTVDAAALSADLIQTAAGKLVIVIGDEPFNMTTLTANAGGSLGKVAGKPVVFTILSPEQAYAPLEKADTYIVRFYPNGMNEPSVVLQCKKMEAPAAIEGMPRTYIGEIVQASVKD